MRRFHLMIFRMAIALPLVARLAGGQVSLPTWDNNADTNQTTPEACAREKKFVGTRVTAEGNTTYGLSMLQYGIEQWENGKLYERRKERWDLTCSSPRSNSRSYTQNNSTSCNLSRLIMDDWSDTVIGEGRVIGIYEHSPANGNLTITTDNWPSGELDFEFELTDGNKIQVYLNLIYVPWSSTDAYASICLNSFKAYSTGRGQLSRSVSNVEYRIQAYDEIIQVPVEMRGFYTPTAKLNHEIMAGLSEDDALIWQELDSTFTQGVRNAIKLYEGKLTERVKSKYGKSMDELSEAETNEVKETFRVDVIKLWFDHLSELLAESRISPEGREHIYRCHRSSSDSDNKIRE